MNMEGTAVARKSIWGIIGDVFFSPTQAFEAFRPKPNIWIPLIITMVLAGLAAGLTAEQAAMDQYNLMKNSTTLPPQAIEQIRVDAQNPNALLASVTPAIFVPIVGIIAALIAWALGGFMFGGKASFSQIWGCGLLAGLIGIVGGIVKVPLVIAKGTAQLSLGPAALMSQPDYFSIFNLILHFADVFTIWGTIVAAIGYSVTFGISRGKGAAIAIILWVLVVSFVAGGAALGLSFAGVETRFF